jgi:hypothetical protein
MFENSCFTILEVACIQSETYSKAQSNIYYKSISENYNRFPSWWENTKKTLNNASCIATQEGKLSLKLTQQNAPNYDSYLSRFLSSPVVFESFEIWVLMQALQECELKFLEVCSTPNDEPSLTAHLLSTLNSKAESLQDKYVKPLSITGSQLNLKKLELQVQNRESLTGGDFALLLEWKDIRGEIKVCPIVFQAKRTSTAHADISQKNKKHGYQFKTLSRSKCNPAYIFYNCDTQGITTAPRLPTVKSIADIEPMTNSLKTSTVDKALSLSVFILHVMTSNDIFTTKSRKNALHEILVGVNELELSNIVTLSVDPNAIQKYELEYKNYLAKQKAKENNNDIDCGF